MFATFNVIFAVFKDQQEISIREERASHLHSKGNAFR